MLAVRFLAIVAVATLWLQATFESAEANQIQQSDLNSNNTTNSASQDSFKEATTERSALAETSRSNRRSGRGGRMLDLDKLAGDIDKTESMERGRSVSGTRQSRILNEDLVSDPSQIDSDQKLVARSKQPGGSKKKLAIQGFIPIVSLNNGKGSIDALTGGNDDEDDTSVPEDTNHQHPQQYAASNDQVMSSYGGKTSMGHASYGIEPLQQEDASAAETASRARKLGQKALINSLASHSPTRLVSNLFNHANQNKQQQMLMQAPSNAPMSMMSLMQDSSASECICVPFYQCKSGYLSESQLSKAQMQQLVYQERNHQRFQTPRTGAQQASHQQQQQLPQQQSQQQQQLNEAIYEQLRQTIESGNLENLSQQQMLQLQQQAGINQADLHQYLDERSKAGSGNLLQNATANIEDTEERSLLKPLGRRSSSQCGVLRTCCKLPPNLFSSPFQPSSLHLNTGQQSFSHKMNQPSAMPFNTDSPFGSGMPGSQPHLTQAHSHRDVQYLRPVSQSLIYPSLQEAVSLGYQQQAASQHLPSQHIQRPAHQPKLDDYISNQQYQRQQKIQQSNPLSLPYHQQQQTIRNSGFFMEGRCGARHSTGITGRVQNEQALENSAEFGEFPSQVAILKRIGSSESLFVCSAVLISSQWLATAAHCVRKHSVSDLKVRLGEWDVQRDDEFYPFVEQNLSDIIVHPEFQSSNLNNDIALLRMDAPIGHEVPHIAPACLPRAHESFEGQRCWVAGWGKDAFGQRGAFQTVLRKVDLPVLSRPTCEQALRSTRLGPFFRLHQSAICAGGEQGKDACEGDGGSGLYCVDNGVIKAIGLVSWGLSCGQAGVPGVYASMKSFVPWIETVVASSGEENVYSNGNLTGANMDLTGLISERSKAGGATNSTISPTESSAMNSTLPTNHSAEVRSNQ